MLAFKETNKLVHKSGKSPRTIFSLQQGTSLKYKTNWLIPEEKAPNRGKRVSGCTNQSDLPYCTEPISFQMSIPYSNCQALGQPVPFRGILKGRPSGQVVLAAARALPENSPTGDCCPPAARLLASFVKIC